MPRWPYVHILRRSCTDFRASLRTEPQLVKLTVPREVLCARPHRIITPSDSRSCIRATGMLCEMATLKRAENCHQGCTTESFSSTSSRFGITSRCGIGKAYGSSKDKKICPHYATPAPDHDGVPACSVVESRVPLHFQHRHVCKMPHSIVRRR